MAFGLPPRLIKDLFPYCDLDDESPKGVSSAEVPRSDLVCVCERHVHFVTLHVPFSKTTFVRAWL